MENSQRSWSANAKGFILFYGFYCIFLIKGALSVFSFPKSYSVSELFVSYSGGFIRRGLIGTILYALAPYVSLPALVIGGYITLFAAFLVIAYRSFSKNFDMLTVFFVFISPAYFLFHLKTPDVFARKDILIQLFIFISYGTAVSCILNDKRKLFWPTLFLLSLYTVSFLIHEMVLFYFPLPFVLLGVAFQKRKKLLYWISIGIAVVAVSLAVAYLFPGTLEQRNAICAAWKQYYPTLSCVPLPQFQQAGMLHPGEQANAISYIGTNLENNIQDVKTYYQSVSSPLSALCGLILAALPLAFICLGYNCLRTIKALFSSLPLRIFFWIAACVPWILSLIATDFGRHISGACFSYLFFLLSLQRIAPQPCGNWLRKLHAWSENSSRRQWLVIALLLIYGLGWKLDHWAPVGQSFISFDPLVRGLLR